MPSRQAIISDIVPDSKLMNAISLSNSSMNLTRVAGPALAGFLILLFDTAGVFFVISIIYAFAAVTIGMVHYAPNRVAKTGKNGSYAFEEQMIHKDLVKDFFKK